MAPTKACPHGPPAPDRPFPSFNAGACYNVIGWVGVSRSIQGGDGHTNRWAIISVEIREITILSDDARTLIALLDRELLGEYAPEHMHTVEFESFHRDGGVFAVAYDAETPIACGALRPLTETEVEVKRMYVVDSHRGRGVSRQVLTFLETKARQLGFRKLMLETGDQQEAAIGLYSKAGYQRVEAFGEYLNGPRSVCFAKDL